MSQQHQFQRIQGSNLSVSLALRRPFFQMAVLQGEDAVHVAGQLHIVGGDQGGDAAPNRRRRFGGLGTRATRGAMCTAGIGLWEGSEKPKVNSYREQLLLNLSKICSTEHNKINVKATTTERLGFTGREEGIASICSVLLHEIN